jgi:endonuclease/exonuclease/phosphatase family metal-dependent hydrolase
VSGTGVAGSPAGESLTVISWNVDGWHTIRDAQIALIDASGAELALLQEVTPESAEVLRAAGWQIVTALELLPPDHVERAARRPRFSCAVATRGPLTIIGVEVLTDAPSPVRTLVARITRLDGGREFTAMSAALPPGSMWGREAKQGQARVIGAHLAGVDGPVIVGMDRNGPKHERFDPAETEWWPEDEPALFAADAPHGLRDVLLTLHAEHPERREAARAERPDGPLEVSYVEQRTTPPSPRRYDVILASAHWHVKDVTYGYDASVAAGSDHGSAVASVTEGDTKHR